MPRRPAAWGWKGRSRSIAIGPIAPAGRRIGSRSRTASMRSAGFRISPVKPAARRQAPLPSVCDRIPAAAAANPLRQPPARRDLSGSMEDPGAPLRSATACIIWPRNHLSRARQNEVRAPQPEGGTNDERHRSRRQGRVGPVEVGQRDLGGLESSRPCAALRSRNGSALRAPQARRRSRVWASVQQLAF